MKKKFWTKEERKKEYHSVKKRKKILHDSDQYRRCSVQVAVKPKFTTHNVKKEVSFSLYKYQPYAKTLKVASNCNFESCLSIRCLAPLHILAFFCIFAAGFSFAFLNFAHYCVVLLNALLSNRDKKERVCNGLLFPGNIDPSSLTPGGPIVLLICGFRRRDNLLAWREFFAILGGILPL